MSFSRVNYEVVINNSKYAVGNKVQEKLLGFHRAI